MNRLWSRAACALVMSMPAAAARADASRGNAAPGPDPSGRSALSTHFTYKATIETPPAGNDLHLWIPLPSDSDFQTVTHVQVSGPGQNRITREARYGNRMVYVHMPKPSGPVAVSVDFDVLRKPVHRLESGRTAPRAHAQPAGLFLKPDAKVPLGGRYAEIAREVTAGKTTTLEKMRAIYEHVVATMQYDYKKESPHYAEGDVAFVCDYKKGNCSDLHSYITSLARSLGVPSYIEYGFPLSGIPLPDPLPKESSIAGYHCWLWFKDPERGWLPLDASDGRRWLDAKREDVKDFVFGNLVLDRNAVALSRGRDITLNPPQKAGPLNNFIYPYAESDGKPVDVKWEVRYRLEG